MSAFIDNCCPLPSTTTSLPVEELVGLAEALKVLAEPMRLGIISIIASQHGAAVCACVFPEALGISQPTASHHLKRLTEAGILLREQRGKWAWFTLVPEQVHQITRILSQLSDVAI